MIKIFDSTVHNRTVVTPLLQKNPRANAVFETIIDSEHYICYAYESRASNRDNNCAHAARLFLASPHLHRTHKTCIARAACNNDVTRWLINVKVQAVSPVVCANILGSTDFIRTDVVKFDAATFTGTSTYACYTVVCMVQCVQTLPADFVRDDDVLRVAPWKMLMQHTQCLAEDDIDTPCYVLVCPVFVCPYYAFLDHQKTTMLNRNTFSLRLTYAVPNVSALPVYASDMAPARVLDWDVNCRTPSLDSVHTNMCRLLGFVADDWIPDIMHFVFCVFIRWHCELSVCQRVMRNTATQKMASDEATQMLYNVIYGDTVERPGTTLRAFLATSGSARVCASIYRGLAEDNGAWFLKCLREIWTFIVRYECLDQREYVVICALRDMHCTDVLVTPMHASPDDIVAWYSKPSVHEARDEGSAMQQENAFLYWWPLSTSKTQEYPPRLCADDARRFMYVRGYAVLLYEHLLRVHPSVYAASHADARVYTDAHAPALVTTFIRTCAATLNVSARIVRLAASPVYKRQLPYGQRGVFSKSNRSKLDECFVDTPRTVCARTRAFLAARGDVIKDWVDFCCMNDTQLSTTLTESSAFSAYNISARRRVPLDVSVGAARAAVRDERQFRLLAPTADEAPYTVIERFIERRALPPCLVRMELLQRGYASDGLLLGDVKHAKHWDRVDVYSQYRSMDGESGNVLVDIEDLTVHLTQRATCDDVRSNVASARKHAMDYKSAEAWFQTKIAKSAEKSTSSVVTGCASCNLIAQNTSTSRLRCPFAEYQASRITRAQLAAWLLEPVEKVAPELGALGALQSSTYDGTSYVLPNNGSDNTENTITRITFEDADDEDEDDNVGIAMSSIFTADDPMDAMNMISDDALMLPAASTGALLTLEQFTRLCEYLDSTKSLRNSALLPRNGVSATEACAAFLCMTRLRTEPENAYEYLANRAEHDAKFKQLMDFYSSMRFSFPREYTFAALDYEKRIK